MKKTRRRILGLVLLPTMRENMRAGIVGGALSYAEEAGLEHWVKVYESAELEAPLDPEIEGVVAFLGSEHLHQRFVRQKYPVINVSNSWRKEDGVGHFLNDDRRIGQMAAEHLLGKGHRDFLVLELAGRVFARERAEGFTRKAMETGGRVRNFSSKFSISTEGWAEFSLRAEEMLRGVIEDLPPGAAIFAVNDWIAVIAQLVLHDFFPEREVTTGVIGVDNSHGWGHTGPLPGLSTVLPDYEGIGREALRWLAEHPGLEGKKLVGTLRRRFPPQRVIERASTAGMACADPYTARIARWAWNQIRLGRPLSASEVATVHKISRRSLDRRFGEHLGRPLGEYLQKLRLDLARHLLRETELSVAEISERCGYAKQSALSRALREAEGITPREMRQSTRLAAGKNSIG